MSRIRTIIFPTVACVIAAVFCRCAGLQPLSGATSETTNGFVALVHDQNGTAVSRALVRIRPSNYLSDTGSSGIPYHPASVIDTFTDVTGRFTVTNIDTGNYSIEIQDGMGGGALVKSTALKDSLVDCGAVLVRPVGNVCGFIDRAAVAGSVTVFVRISGMERLVLANPLSGVFFLNGLPQEHYILNFTASSPAYAPREISVSIVSNVTQDIGKIPLFPFNNWTFSRIIGLNTTASGAEVTGDVYDFPMLLLLTRDVFDFSQASPDGSDLRFMKSDSTPLPYEIERWDATNSLAEIWVKLDTVYGDNDSQSITMYWGNPAASGESNSAAVFDTADGFQGVWHLSEAGNTTAFDATANGYDGTPSGMSTASCVPGIIGNAQEFDGSSSMITMANTSGSRLNFPQNGNYSLSAWAYVDTLGGNWHEIAGKGHEQYYIKFKSIGNGRAIWEFVEFQDQLGWEYTEDSVPPSPGIQQWVHVTGVREGSQQRLYINGSLVSSTILLKAGSYSRNTGDDFMIGRYAREVTIPLYEGWCYFDGKIDEVRISSNVPSANRIKLSYMNQRANDRLVVFR